MVFGLLEFTKSIPVPNRSQEAYLGGLVQVGAVHEEPGGGHVRQSTTTFHNASQEAVELCRVVAKGLSAPELAEKVAEGSADGSDLHIQVVLADPILEVVDAIEVAQAVDVQGLCIDPSCALKVLIEDQGLLVGGKFGHPFPGGYLTKVAAGRGPQVSVSILTTENRNEKLLRGPFATVTGGLCTARSSLKSFRLLSRKSSVVASIRWIESRSPRAIASVRLGGARTASWSKFCWRIGLSGTRSIAVVILRGARGAIIRSPVGEVVSPPAAVGVIAVIPIAPPSIIASMPLPWIISLPLACRGRGRRGRGRSSLALTVGVVACSWVFSSPRVVAPPLPILTLPSVRRSSRASVGLVLCSFGLGAGIGRLIVAKVGRRPSTCPGITAWQCPRISASVGHR